MSHTLSIPRVLRLIKAVSRGTLHASIFCGKSIHSFFRNHVNPFVRNRAMPFLRNRVIPFLRNRVKPFMKLTFIKGPQQLVSSRISTKCAAIMVAMCSPALLFCFILTIPSLIFQSPQQHAYFYFGQILNQDPTRWAVLVLTALCTLLSLAIPASLPGPRSEIRY